MKAIKINGEDSDVVSVQLKDILNCMNQGGEAFWGIMWFEVIADLSDEQSVLDLENRINKSNSGMSVSWEELLKLSEQIQQSINLIIVGDQKSSNIMRYDTEEQMYDNCDYVIEMLDSSYWTVHSNNDCFIENLFARLKGVEYL